MSPACCGNTPCTRVGWHRCEVDLSAIEADAAETSIALPFDGQSRTPTAAEIVDCVASDFGVPLEVALDWLAAADFANQQLRQQLGR